MKLELPKLILASGSPRRSEILTCVGWAFEKRTTDVDETLIPGEDPVAYVTRLSLAKASAVAANISDGLVLGADTVVLIDGEILGKPIDLDDAASMLRKLSGRWHDVLTGVSLIKVVNGEVRSLTETELTGVKFVEMKEDEIRLLVEKGEPLDKAGAYAVQAQAALFIESVRGVYWNVVGLPINLVYRLAKELETKKASA